MLQSTGPQSLAYTHLIVIRHGETAWNASGGCRASSTSAQRTGHAQARALAEALAGEPIDAVYTSDLSRAAQPPAAGAGAGLECACGAAPARALLWRSRRHDVRRGGATASRGFRALAGAHARLRAAWGESLREFHERAVEVALSLSRRHPGERIALVAHGGVLDCLYREATGMTLEAPREHELLNASVNRLRCDSVNLTLLQWADVSHLEALTLDEVDRRVP
jgi:probable phosphoglycerate mutase